MDNHKTVGAQCCVFVHRQRLFTLSHTLFFYKARPGIKYFNKCVLN